MAVSPRTAASWLLSVRASRGTGIVAGSMLNGITTRPAPQVAITVSARSAAVPIRRWEIRFIPRGIFTRMRRRREEHFPIPGCVKTTILRQQVVAPRGPGGASSEPDVLRADAQADQPSGQPPQPRHAPELAHRQGRPQRT